MKELGYQVGIEGKGYQFEDKNSGAFKTKQPQNLLKRREDMKDRQTRL